MLQDGVLYALGRVEELRDAAWRGSREKNGTSEPSVDDDPLRGIECSTDMKFEFTQGIQKSSFELDIQNLIKLDKRLCFK